MHGFKGERVLMRIHLDERDKFHGKPLYAAIVDLLRSRHYAGATVFRGIMGFGPTARLHTDRFDFLAFDLPWSSSASRRRKGSWRSSPSSMR